MYLTYFGFNEFPFTLTPNLNFFCNLVAYKEALNTIMVSLSNGEGFVKVTGEVGTGKTLICRKLLNTLSDEYLTAYISNPGLDCFNLQKAIARELEIQFPDNIDHHGLLHLLTKALVAMHQAGKKVVIVVDEAHVLSDEALEGLRLITNLETESSKLVQIVLVGQPELDKRLSQPHLRQLRQRIVFSYKLHNLHQKEFLAYLGYRLTIAGYDKTYNELFSEAALKLLFKATRGIPRLINIICHKALLLAYGYNKSKIDLNIIKTAIADTESISLNILQRYSCATKIGAWLLTAAVMGMLAYLTLRILHL